MVDGGCWMLDAGCWMLDAEGHSSSASSKSLPQEGQEGGNGCGCSMSLCACLSLFGQNGRMHNALMIRMKYAAILCARVLSFVGAIFSA
jgi:hypothetical protein